MITVGMAVFNEEKTIGKVLENLLSQDYPEAFEILIVGGGPDKTLDIIQDYAKRFRNTRFIKETKEEESPLPLMRFLNLPEVA
ncbi:MAG: N-glycosyltransferase [Candidatus Bathyarchaeota archaeon BA2]|nr:MAG: N-glycosyltransferase [Candidatus Bathyarchaeota archaeon BA2]